MRSSFSRRRLPSSPSRRRSGRPLTGHRSGPVRSSPPLVAITRPGGYGWSASAINSSLTYGPYDSAVSMSVVPNSTHLRSTATASVRSAGGPQIPLPVMRIAPNPRRWTGRSPPSRNVPLRVASITTAPHSQSRDLPGSVAPVAAAARGALRSRGEAQSMPVHRWCQRHGTSSSSGTTTVPQCSTSSA